jgi:hypothetical protein
MTTPTTPPPVDTQTQGALDQLKALLNSWGLGTLYQAASGYLIQGLTSDEVTLKLQDTPEYKTRFAGNEIRKANNLPVLSPAQYIATEEQYQQVMRNYGLPPGFYDKPSDFNEFIGNDVSPAEIDARAKIAHDQFIAAPDYVKNLWSQYFGTQGDAIASILDPHVATQVIQDRSTQIGIGGAAAAQGLGVSQPRAQQLQQAGVTLAGAQKAYQQIAQSLPIDQQIAKRFGTTFDQSNEENDLLLGLGQDSMKRQTLYDEEQSLFKQRSSADNTSLGVSLAY